MEFAVTSSQSDGRSIVTVVGEFDAHVASQVQDVIDPLLQGPATVVVDLSGVPFIDSTGLGVLVTTLKRIREAGGTLDVVAAAPRVLKVFAITGLDVVIPLHSTLDEARAAQP